MQPNNIPRERSRDPSLLNISTSSKQSEHEMRRGSAFRRFLRNNNIIKSSCDGADPSLVLRVRSRQLVAADWKSATKYWSSLKRPSPARSTGTQLCSLGRRICSGSGLVVSASVVIHDDNSQESVMPSVETRSSTANLSRRCQKLRRQEYSF